MTFRDFYIKVEL